MSLRDGGVTSIASSGLLRADSYESESENEIFSPACEVNVAVGE